MSVKGQRTAETRTGTHRVDEVEKRPKFFERVLDGGPAQQQAVLGVEALELPDQAAVAVLNSLAFVHDQVAPLVLLQVPAVDDAHLVRRDHHLHYIRD
jgi:hypothetical protein